MNRFHSKCLPLELTVTGYNINKNIAITQHPRSWPLVYHHHADSALPRCSIAAYYKPALPLCHSEATHTFGSLDGASNSVSLYTVAASRNLIDQKKHDTPDNTVQVFGRIVSTFITIILLSDDRCVARVFVRFWLLADVEISAC